MSGILGYVALGILAFFGISAAWALVATSRAVADSRARFSGRTLAPWVRDACGCARPQDVPVTVRAAIVARDGAARFALEFVGATLLPLVAALALVGTPLNALIAVWRPKKT